MFLPKKLTWFCYAVYQLCNNFFLWFQVPYKITWLNMHIPEKDELFSKHILPFKYYGSFLSVYLLIWNHQNWLTPKCTFECLCVISIQLIWKRFPFFWKLFPFDSDTCPVSKENFQINWILHPIEWKPGLLKNFWEKDKLCPPLLIPITMSFFYPCIAFCRCFS